MTSRSFSIRSSDPVSINSYAVASVTLAATAAGSATLAKTSGDVGYTAATNFLTVPENGVYRVDLVCLGTSAGTAGALTAAIHSDTDTLGTLNTAAEVSAKDVAAATSNVLSLNCSTIISLSAGQSLGVKGTAGTGTIALAGSLLVQRIA